MDTAKPLRIDHVRLSNPSRTLNGARWFFTRHGCVRSAWKSVLSGKSDWSAVPPNVEPAEAPMSTA